MLHHDNYYLFFVNLRALVEFHCKVKCTTCILYVKCISIMAESDKTLIEDGKLSNNNRKNSAPNIVPHASGSVHSDTHPTHHAAVSEPSTLKRKQTSFQITSVTVKGSRLSTDGGEDSADDLDESHTEDANSDILDCSRTTDIDNDQLSEDNNTNNDDASSFAPSIPVKCKKELPVKEGKENVVSAKFPSDASKIVKPNLPCENIQTECVKPPALPDQWQHRFRVVKIVRSEPFKRGRWLCMDFMDPPAPVTEAKAEIVETSVSSNIHMIGSLSDSIPADKIAHIYEISPSDTYPGSISVAAGSDKNQQPMYGIFLPVNNGQYPLITGMHSRVVHPSREREVKPQESAQTVTSTDRTIHHPSNTSISQQPQNVNVSSQPSQNIAVSLPQSQNTTTYVQQSQNISANLQQSQNITPNASIQPPQNIAQQPQNGSASKQQSQNVSISAHQAQNVTTTNVQHVQNIPANLQQSQNITTNIHQSQNVAVSLQQMGNLKQPQVSTDVPQNVSTNLQQQQNISSNLQQQQNIASNLQQQQNIASNLQQQQNINTSLQQQNINTSLQQPNINTSSQQQNISANHYQSQNTSHSTMTEIQHQAVTSLKSQAPVQPLSGIQSLPPSQNIVKDSVTVIPGDSTMKNLVNYATILPQSQMTQESQPLMQQNIQKQVVTPPQSISEIATKSVNEVSSKSQLGEVMVNQSIPKQQIPLVSMAQASHVGTQASSAVNIPEISSTSSIKNPETVVPSQVIQNHVETQELRTPPSTNLQVSQEVLSEIPSTKSEVNGEETSESVPSGTSTVAIDNKIEQAMDLVKSHLMFAVREEVDVLKEKITELMERISQLEYENNYLRANATQQTLEQLNQSQLLQQQQQNQPSIVSINSIPQVLQQPSQQQQLNIQNQQPTL